MQPENLRNDRNASNYKNYKKYEIIEVGSRYVGRHIVRWQLDKTHTCNLCRRERSKFEFVKSNRSHQYFFCRTSDAYIYTCLLYTSPSPRD